MGSVEVWRPLMVRDLGLRGALLEATEPLRTGTRVKGRLRVRGLTEDVEGDVRHWRALAGDHEAARYEAGVSFADALSARMADALVEPPLGKPLAGAAPDRRRGWRIPGAGRAVFELVIWTSVQLHDLSIGGTMFTTRVPLEAGSKGRLRTTLGSRAFVADIELGRIEPPAEVDRRGAYRVGASFISINEESRRSLASFLATVGG